MENHIIVFDAPQPYPVRIYTKGTHQEVARGKDEVEAFKQFDKHEAEQGNRKADT